MGKKQPLNLPPDKDDRALLRQLDKILASNPYHIDANYEKGIILLRLCRSDEALACFENVLCQDPTHMKSCVGKGRALTLEEKYDEARKCFGKVPDGEVHADAVYWNDINDASQAQRVPMPTNTPETADEKKFNDSLENWMTQHLGKIQHLEILLRNFKGAKDSLRRKPGHVLHACLVKKFYESGGNLKVIAVECKCIEPDTDVDIRLGDDIYIQVWHGKKPAEYTLEQNLNYGISGPMHVDPCEQLKPVLKKLNQLPSNTGKGFVLNFAPGISGIVSPSLHDLCSERKCVMEMSPGRHHINVYGKSNFKYCDEARQIGRVLNRPLKFFLGDLNEMRAQGRDPIGESAYGINVFQPQFRNFYYMSKDELLHYAQHDLKCPHYDKLVDLSRRDIHFHVWCELMSIDSDCQEDKP